MSTSNTLASTVKLSEYFSKLPTCKSDGTNWVFYRSRFIFAMDAAGLDLHFEEQAGGTAKPPVAPTVTDPANPTSDETAAIEAYQQRHRIWKSEQAVIKQGIASTIPGSLFLKVKGEKTAKEMWDKVKAEFEKKSQMVTVDLRKKLQDEQCTEEGDVEAHLNKLQTYRETLISMGADPGDDNFV